MIKNRLLVGLSYQRPNSFGVAGERRATIFKGDDPISAAVNSPFPKQNVCATIPLLNLPPVPSRTLLLTLAEPAPRLCRIKSHSFLFIFFRGTNQNPTSQVHTLACHNQGHPVTPSSIFFISAISAHQDFSGSYSQRSQFISISAVHILSFLRVSEVYHLTANPIGF